MSTSQTIAPSTPGQASFPRSSSFRDASSSLGTTKTVRWGQEQESVKAVVTSNPQRPSSSMSTSASAAISSIISTPVKRVPSGSGPSSATPLLPPAAKTAPPTSSSSSSHSQSPRPSSTSLRNRVKWNLGASLAVVMVPKLEISKRMYWSALDIIYATLGGRSDQRVDASVAWLKWALFIVFLVNLLEALALLQFAEPAIRSTSHRPNGLTQPPGRSKVVDVASRTPPSSTVRPQRPSEARYSPHSPLKSNLEAAVRSASSKFNSSSPAHSSPLNPSGSGSSTGGGGGSLGGIGGRRLPSAPPTSGASPLAAYLARRGTSREYERMASADVDAVGDLSSDSIEVDRALRALSNSYMRSASAMASSP